MIDKNFVEKIERAHFRTDEDTGANLNALFIWNLVRKELGLDNLQKSDLPSYCNICDNYHIGECKKLAKRVEP